MLFRSRVLILLDRIKLVPARLEAFLARGGTVLCAAGVAGPEHSGWIGAELVPELRMSHAWRWQDSAPVAEPFHHVPVTAISARVLARAANGAPLLLEQPHGAGRVITCLVPWFEGISADLCGVALAVFDHVIGSVQPVRVQGLPIEWLSTRGDREYTVVLSNNSDQQWTGTVAARAVDASYPACRELLTGRHLATTTSPAGTSVHVQVPPFGVALLSWTRE